DARLNARHDARPMLGIKWPALDALDRDLGPVTFARRIDKFSVSLLPLFRADHQNNTIALALVITTPVPYHTALSFCPLLVKSFSLSNPLWNCVISHGLSPFSFQYFVKMRYRSKCVFAAINCRIKSAGIRTALPSFTFLRRFWAIHARTVETLTPNSWAACS